jgi:hypothetical protein
MSRPSSQASGATRASLPAHACSPDHQIEAGSAVKSLHLSYSGLTREVGGAPVQHFQRHAR